MKKHKIKNTFLDELRKIPIIQVACEKCGVSRTSVYRWRKKDQKFADAMDEALKDGEALINDMTEAQLLTLIKNENWNAISFWLRHRNPKFREKVEITGDINVKDELTPEQEEVVKKALGLAFGLKESKEINNDNKNQNE